MDARYTRGFRKAGHEQLKAGVAGPGSLETSLVRGQGLPRFVAPKEEEEELMFEVCC